MTCFALPRFRAPDFFLSVFLPRAPLSLGGLRKPGRPAGTGAGPTAGPAISIALRGRYRPFSAGSGSLTIWNSRPPVIGVASIRAARSTAAAQRPAPADRSPDQGVGCARRGRSTRRRGSRRDQAVGAVVGQPDEQAEPGDPGDPALELRADPVGQEGGHVAVGGVAFGGHGPALGGGDQFGRVLHLRDVVGRSGRRRPGPSARISAAVDDQVGVAADRRGEVGVAWPGSGRSGRYCRSE